MCPVTRLPCQLGEVLPSSFTGSDLLGRGSGLPSSNRPPCGPLDRVPHPIGLPPSCFPLSSCSPLAAVSGAPCQSQGLGSRLSLPFASSPDLFSAPLPSPSGLLRPPEIRVFCLAWASREFLLAGNPLFPLLPRSP